MVSMKTEVKMYHGDEKPSEVSIDQPEYPYGLEIHLDDQSLSKIDLGDKKVGDVCMFMIKTKITSINERDDEKGTNRSMSLQITDMDKANVGPSDVADRWYSSKEDK